MPLWRSRDDNSRVFGREIGSWDLHLYSGENGLVLALVMLRWWHDAIGDYGDPAHTGDWMDALEEVYWVINQLSITLS